QGFELQQPQDKELVAAGETLTLTCTMSGGGPVGAVRWLKGLGSGNKTVYEQKGSFPRVTRVVNESGTDFSIHIRDVRPEDAGTYYCVKFEKSLLGDEVFQRGNGTEVSVRAEPGDARHQALPLFPVSPSVRVVADPPSPIEVNKTVNFTCHVNGFYPGDVAVTWLENGTEMKVENTSRLVETPQGLFELRSLVEVKATEEKNGSVFTCRVVHDAQNPISEMAALRIAAPARDGLSDWSQ
ncbi:Tyrosine-protein phosphatase non-receptor type substrate 1, partial [Pygoscelis adeliae]